MRHDEQVRQARKLLQHIEAGSTALADDIYANPVAQYVCPAHASAERDGLFKRWPLTLGLSSRAPEPGDYFEEDHSGVPILVVRGRDRRLRAFANVCRHRGARVAQGCGKARNFSCPYHGWVYDLDGSLRARANDAAFAAMPKETHGLTPLPIEERHGMIWVGTTPGATLDLDQSLGGLDDDLAGFGLDRYHHYETRVLRQAMNWKLVVDTFLETYHLKVLHPTTVGPILYTDLATFDAFGRNLRMIAPRVSFKELREQPESDWDLVRFTAMVFVLFPNTVFIMQGDHLEVFHVYPDGDPDHAVMAVSLYTPEPAVSESARGHWDRNFKLLMDTVQQEDFPLAERVQRGFHAGAQDHLTFGRNEPSLQHFHKSVFAVLANSAA